MATVHYTAKVKEERLLELPEEARALGLQPGDKVSLTLDRTQETRNDARYATLEEAVARMTHRTPEEIAATRERVLKASPPPRELPPGKTLADVIVGQWPGDETDEEIADALERLS